MSDTADKTHIPDYIAKGQNEDKYFIASQWQLIRWRFLKHKLAVISLIILGVFYLMVIFAEFIAPYNVHGFDEKYKLAPPHKIYFVDAERRFHLRPFVYLREQKIDLESWRIAYIEDKSRPMPIRLFVRGDPYNLWNLIPMDLHLFGVDDGKLSLMGYDQLGRDVFSRAIFGARISLTIGLVGVVISFLLGILIGGISGYYGGRMDVIIQRIIESIRSVPTIPLWMALSGALPHHWPVVKTYFAIVVVLSIVGWTGLARIVRGKFLAVREEDFILAAELDGAGRFRIIFKYLLPSFYSYIIASLTLSMPRMILAETALSFLGLGMQPPAVSWGVMLRDAQHVRVLATSPWMLLPAVFVVLSILVFNFVGDGIRDAADPYSST